MARIGYKRMLRKMSTKAIHQLELDIESEFTRRSEIERAQNDIHAQIKAAGFSISDLVKRTGTKRKAKVRYAHKKDPNKVWSGFGPKPQWVKSGHGRKI